VWRGVEGHEVSTVEQADLDRATAAARAVLGDAAFGAEYERGRGLTLEQAFSEVEVAR
jgi:hypothetical protein